MAFYSTVNEAFTDNNELDRLAREVNESKKKHKLIKSVYKDIINDSNKNKIIQNEFYNPDNIAFQSFMPNKQFDCFNDNDSNPGYTLIEDIHNQNLSDSANSYTSGKQSFNLSNLSESPKINSDDSFMNNLKELQIDTQFSDESFKSSHNSYSDKSSSSSDKSKSIKKIKSKMNKMNEILKLIQNSHPDDDSLSSHKSDDSYFVLDHVKSCKTCKKKIKKKINHNHSLEHSNHIEEYLDPRFIDSRIGNLTQTYNKTNTDINQYSNNMNYENVPNYNQSIPKQNIQTNQSNNEFRIFGQSINDFKDILIYILLGFVVLLIIYLFIKK